MDLEGIARKLPEDEAKRKILEYLEFYKGKRDMNERIANAIIVEVKNSKKFEEFEPIRSGIKAGDSGLGSRGIGDHLIHKFLFQISNKKEEFEDAGIINNIAIAVDGIHSRLSYFPFLAGFYATKATIRDIMVKGAEPLGVIIDIHLSDDTDVSYLFDFEAGVTTVTDFLNIKVLAGSTLRIGGDMVIGERISGGVGALGIINGKPLPRNNISEGMKIIMTQGNGGGTIASTAIFNGYENILNETLKLDDLIACKLALQNKDKIFSMTDVTNGGIRIDAVEISENSKVTFKIDIEKFLSLINPKILKMLNDLQIDPLGVSIDSILIFSYDDNIIKILAEHGIKADIIGEVIKYSGSPIISSDGKKIEPRFRESPYTPVKKVIDNTSPYTIKELEERLANSMLASLDKKKNVLKNLKGSFT
ncbi:AIR synthase [Acidianus sulfidivorans JP7]|uniref:AIR synthase n=1 Tax=Acidianus sulfidivorans JP7 TaxID=619593 RepID=A0A2U9IM80_9CREN|nr:AIR synthase-related protein [Acidianus sulfidivorans]AWR97120.1 AIR synthase [Acidianus sulfidivorans JP7]